MPSFNRMLRDEIARVVGIQVEQITAKLSKSNTQLRAEVTELRRRVRALELRAIRQDVTPAGKAPISEADLKEMKRQRPTSTMVKQLRQSLELSQRELALLLGVSTQAVYLWERHKGRLNLRDRAKTALFEIRKLTREEARERLDAPRAS
jgi:DNA-binding transcriptional regulator YiaG